MAATLHLDGFSSLGAEFVEGTPPLYSRSETGNGEGCIRHDCRERREAVSQDDEQESEPYQRQEEKIKHCSQVLSWQVSGGWIEKILSYQLTEGPVSFQ